MVVKIIIKDTGIGMDASMRNYLIKGIDSNKEIWSPYIKKGNDLGYKIVRYITKLIDAKILIDILENKGTTVSIHIKN
jgi:sensor histidine kinase YesM